MTRCRRIEPGTLMYLNVGVIDPLGPIPHLKGTAPSEGLWLRSRRVREPWRQSWSRAGGIRRFDRLRKGDRHGRRRPRRSLARGRPWPGLRKPWAVSGSTSTTTCAARKCGVCLGFRLSKKMSKKTPIHTHLTPISNPIFPLTHFPSHSSHSPRTQPFRFSGVITSSRPFSPLSAQSQRPFFKFPSASRTSQTVRPFRLLPTMFNIF